MVRCFGWGASNRNVRHQSSSCSLQTLPLGSIGSQEPGPFNSDPNELLSCVGCASLDLLPLPELVLLPSDLTVVRSRGDPTNGSFLFRLCRRSVDSSDHPRPWIGLASRSIGGRSRVARIFLKQTVSLHSKTHSRFDRSRFHYFPIADFYL